MKTVIISVIALLIIGSAGFFGYRQIEQAHQKQAEAERAAEIARIDEEKKESLLAHERETEALRIAAERAAREKEEAARQLAAEQERTIAERIAREEAEREAEAAEMRKQEIVLRQAELEAELELQQARLAELHRQQTAELEAKLQETLAALQSETHARSIAEREAEERRARLYNALEQQRLREAQLREQDDFETQIESIRASTSAPYEYRRRQHLRLKDMLDQTRRN